jgi:hypothetical protein
MVRLIPLPARDGLPGDSRLWINPEHITSLAPILSPGQGQDGKLITLAVELKLEGLPTQRAWLATCSTMEEADVRWQRFLDVVAGADRIPETPISTT